MNLRISYVSILILIQNGLNGCSWVFTGGKMKDMNNIALSRIAFIMIWSFGIPEDRSYHGNAIIDKILENTNSDDVKTCISIIKGEIPLDKRNVDNYPVLKKG